MGFRSKRDQNTRTFRLSRAAGETETTEKQSKIGFSWIKETLDFSF
jgi:hypothetical protein